MLTPEQFDAMTEKVFAFHTKQAPGIPIGIVMLDFARDLLGPVKGKINVVAETQACLSDVIQVMIGCTVGNRYMRVLKDVGRYALTLFDRADGRGIRVFVDLAKIDPTKTPETYRFFCRRRDPAVQAGGSAREESGRKIIEEFKTLGRTILGFQRVQLKQFGKPPMLPAETCPGCGETFLQRDAGHLRCDVCAGLADYYTLQQVDQ